MAFQVKRFEFEENDNEVVWKFNLGGLATTQIDFYSQDENVRSLYHLCQDIIPQIQSQIQRKKKLAKSNDRTVRKVCEKLIKSLGLTLSQFSHDVSFHQYFRQSKIKNQQTDFSQSQACKTQQEFRSYKNAGNGSWKHGQDFFQRALPNILNENYNINIKRRWHKLITYHLFFQDFKLSLPQEKFFAANQKYLNSYIKDRKKLSPDYDLFNELYMIVVDDVKEQNAEYESPQNNNWILIDINLSIEDKYISESFLWNPQNISAIAIQNFVDHFLKDLLKDQQISYEVDTFQELLQQCKIQFKTQICYKSLLKKYAALLLNFSTMEISQDIRQYNMPIQLKLIAQDGTLFFEDSFEWDILNENNNVQKFCEQLIQDANIPENYLSQLCYKTRTQINAQLWFKYTMLVKTYKSILRDRQSPKFHTQATTNQIKKNLVYTMDVSLPYNPDQNKPVQNIYFNNSDLFSLLSRNIEILPEEFQEVLLCKQSNRNPEKQSQKMTKNQVEEHLKKINVGLQSNPYIGNIANLYTQNKIWRKCLKRQQQK